MACCSLGRHRYGVAQVLVQPYRESADDLRPRFYGVAPRGNGLRVFHGPTGATSAHDDVGALVSSIGFGSEDTKVGTFLGWRFWENDPLERPQAGVTAGPPVCVISGGGDGALQDFLRFTTGRRSAREILGALGQLPAGVTPRRSLTSRTMPDARTFGELASRRSPRSGLATPAVHVPRSASCGRSLLALGR